MQYYPRIRDLREDRDLTQTQLVQILKMHNTTFVIDKIQRMLYNVF